MKKSILLIPVLLFAMSCSGQTVKKDTTATYKLTEPQILQISQLLSFGEVAAGNSDKISTKDYNAYHAAVLHIDSVLREQYFKFHPVKEKAKKPTN